MQAIVVIETGSGQTTNVIKELKEMSDQITVLGIDLLGSGPYQILVRVSLEDEAETMAVERLICVIDGVKNFEIWLCEGVLTEYQGSQGKE